MVLKHCYNKITTLDKMLAYIEGDKKRYQREKIAWFMA